MKKEDIKTVDAPAGLDDWGALPRALRESIGTGKVVRVAATRGHGSYHAMFARKRWRLRSRTKGEYKYLWLEPLEPQKDTRNGKR